MENRKSIIIIMMFVVFIAFTIQFTRAELIIRLNKNITIDLINNTHKIQLEDGVLNNITKEKYLIVYDSKSEEFSKVEKNFEKIFQYTKKDYDVIEVKDFLNVNNDYSAIILIFENIDTLINIDELMEYCFNGGNLFFGYRLAPSQGFNNIYRKLGINEYGDFQDAYGIRLLENVLIKGDGLEIKDEILMLNSSLSLTLTEDTENLAESIDGVKLLWKKKYGQGNIVYFNGTMLEGKINRGFILGAISKLMEDFIYPIINSKVIFIDDFPSPISKGKNEKITNEFNRDIYSFYKEIWWPNMLEIGTRYNIKYTGTMIGTYNDNVDEINNSLIDINKKDFIYYSREIIDQGGELGIHGYNHQPLTIDDLYNESLLYKPWKNTKSMTKSINIVNELIRSTFPNYELNAYVPPSNILSKQGRKALLDSDANIKIISSLYTSFGSEDVYEQEFEISSDGIIEFPRFTAGYNISDEIIWSALNGITSHGVFSHFVHPDDILDNERSNDKGWTELSKEYDEFNKMIYKNFKWIRGMTASKGANEEIKYLASNPIYINDNDSLKVYNTSFVDGIYYILRTNKDIKETNNSKVTKIDEDTYLIKSLNPVFKIEYKR